MNDFLKILVSLPMIIIFLSFSNNNIHKGSYDSGMNDYIPAPHQTYKEFIQDAYNFYKKNGIAIPDYYYDILGIDDPNTPAWVKAQAIIEPRLCDQIPLWIRKGQLMKESSSYYSADGTIKYINQRRGGNNHKKGAIGPFQVLRIAWDHMRKMNPEFFAGKYYSDMQKNLKLNEDVAAMYLLYIYNGRGNKNWEMTVMLYNRGPWGQIDSDAREYVRKVKQCGTMNAK
jgi:hypothetical protein